MRYLLDISGQIDINTMPLRLSVLIKKSDGINANELGRRIGKSGSSWLYTYLNGNCSSNIGLKKFRKIVEQLALVSDIQLLYAGDSTPEERLHKTQCCITLYLLGLYRDDSPQSRTNGHAEVTGDTEFRDNPSGEMDGVGDCQNLRETSGGDHGSAPVHNIEPQGVSDE